jgi:hypothetical protein
VVVVGVVVVVVVVVVVGVPPAEGVAVAEEAVLLEPEPVLPVDELVLPELPLAALPEPALSCFLPQPVRAQPRAIASATDVNLFMRGLPLSGVFASCNLPPRRVTDAHSGKGIKRAVARMGM